MQRSAIKVDDWDLADLQHDIEKGLLRLPKFQREWVWGPAKVRRLLESIYREFPIGGFFFWQAPDEYKSFYRNIAELNLPDPAPHTPITFILDGQQRITSLYVTLQGLTIDGRDYSHICFDLDEQEFVERTPDNQRYIAVSDLLGKDYHLIYEKLSAERKPLFDRCHRRLTNYPFPVVQVLDKDLDEAITIFERINQGGKPLSLVDLVVAGTWDERFDLRQRMQVMNKGLKAKGFGATDHRVFTELMGLVVNKSATRANQLRIETDDILPVWEELVRSLELAVDFVRTNLGVKVYELMPYRPMLPLLGYFYFKLKERAPTANQKTVLEDWFWHSAFGERYGAAAPTRTTEDRKRVMDALLRGEPVELERARNVREDTLKSLTMNRRSAIKDAVLCLLAKRGPRHFKNNNPIVIDRTLVSNLNRAERHHIFPRNYLYELDWPMAKINAMLNFCYIPAELNKEIMDAPPNQYFSHYKDNNPQFEETMASHLIPVGPDSGIWKNDYDLFLDQRAELIAHEIRNSIAG